MKDSLKSSTRRGPVRLRNMEFGSRFSGLLTAINVRFPFPGCRTVLEFQSEYILVHYNCNKASGEYVKASKLSTFLVKL
jgi:hypothetical protein